MALPLIGFDSLLLKMKRLYYARCDGWSRVCSCARPFARFAVGRKGLVSFWAAITFFVPNATPAATSTGSGIAARYPGDKNIASDPAVIFADDFESYTTPDQAQEQMGQWLWSATKHSNRHRICERVFGSGSRLNFPCQLARRKSPVRLGKRIESRARHGFYADVSEIRRWL